MEFHRFIVFWVHSTRLKLYFLSSITGCYNPDYHGDAYCDDENNNEACFFDGGDCCGSDVDKTYCFECQCLHNVQNSLFHRIKSGRNWGISLSEVSPWLG